MPVEVNTAVFDVDGKINHQTFSRDVTERKALEREVAQLVRERTALLRPIGMQLKLRQTQYY